MRKHLIVLALSLPFCALTAFAQKMTSYEPAYRTQNAQPGMTEFQVYTANTVLIEREIAAAGTDSGTLSISYPTLLRTH